jgi:LssY C-terminus
MRHAVTLLVLFLAIPATAGAATTTLDARLLTPVSSYRTRSGSAISALVTTPLCLADGARLESGITVRGAVTHLHKVGLGLVHESAGMRLEFHELRLGDGREFPVDALLTGIQNARERVDKHGAIHGIRATATLSNRAGERLAFAAMGHPAAIVPLFALETAFFHFPEPEIDYGIGTELDIRIDFQDALGNVKLCPDGAPPTWDEEMQLQALVANVPVWSFSSGQPQDPVTLLYVGSGEQIEAAFAAAGWTGSREHSTATRLNVMRAIAENRAYLDAPMRTLFLEGEEADLSLQKALDTFEKRDHLRIWRRPEEEWGGEPVFASAATRDVAPAFSMRPFGFAHRIESNVDQERDKVVHDLRFTGCVDRVDYVPRPNGLGSGHGTRRGIQSDGRVAVVFLNACQEPRLAVTDRRAGPQAPLLVRCVRRVTLTARNHFLRDNIVWRSADAARIGFGVVRTWVRQRRLETAAARAPLQ